MAGMISYGTTQVRTEPRAEVQVVGSIKQTTNVPPPPTYEMAKMDGGKNDPILELPPLKEENEGPIRPQSAVHQRTTTGEGERRAEEGEEDAKRARSLSASDAKVKVGEKEGDGEDKFAGRSNGGAASSQRKSTSASHSSQDLRRDVKDGSPFAPLLTVEELSEVSRRSSVIDSGSIAEEESTLSVVKSQKRQKRRMANDGENPYEVGREPINRASAIEYGYRPMCDFRAKCISVLSVFITIMSVFVACLVSSIHKVNEGQVGIYLKYGALMDDTTGPGMHTMAPFVTEVREISIRPTTDTLREIATITKDSIPMAFKGVQVITEVKFDKLVTLIRSYGMNFKDTLVYDRIREELRIFCANHTIDEVYNSLFLDIAPHVKSATVTSIGRLGDGGIGILNLAVPKPQIPSDIAQNYKQVKVEWSKQLREQQSQKTEQIRKETQRMQAVADAERDKAVLLITLEKKELAKAGERNISVLQNEINRKREESNADVEHYKKLKQAEANSKLYTDEYVRLELAKALSNNTKYFFSGENSMIGGLLNKIMN